MSGYKIPDSIAFGGFTTAQDVAPFLSGNLKFNAMKLEIVSYGFRIVYSSAVAKYIDFLENGTKFSKKHKDFIRKKTMIAVANYLKKELNGKSYASLQKRADRVTKESLMNLDLRQETKLNSLSRYGTAIF